MKKQDLRVSANNLGSVSRSQKDFLSPKSYFSLHSGRLSFQALSQMVESLDSSFKTFNRSNNIPSPEMFSHAAGYALFAVALSVFAFSPQLFFLDSKVF